jgi:hypothetical protein
VRKPRMADKDALEEAWGALNLLDAPIEEDFYGVIDGIDMVDVGLKALAPVLARLFRIPRAAHEKKLHLDDVLAFVASTGRIEQDLVELAALVVNHIQQARYHGLSTDDIEDVEAARSILHNQLSNLLSAVEKEQMP